MLQICIINTKCLANIHIYIPSPKWLFYLDLHSFSVACVWRNKSNISLMSGSKQARNLLLLSFAHALFNILNILRNHRVKMIGRDLDLKSMAFNFSVISKSYACLRCMKKKKDLIDLLCNVNSIDRFVISKFFVHSMKKSEEKRTKKWVKNQKNWSPWENICIMIVLWIRHYKMQD